MIALFLALSLFAQERIYGPGAISYADLDAVVARRHWQGTERFDLLLAPADCNLLGRWVWVIVGGKVLDGLVVDCESPEHAGMMKERGLLFDGNDWDLVGEEAYFVVRQ